MELSRASIVGAVVGTAAAIVVFTASAAPRDEPVPPGYGAEPCTTLAYDMATTTRAYTEHDWNRHMNLIGCDQLPSGAWAPQFRNRCDVGAWLIAAGWVQHGHHVLALTPAKLGHALDKRHHNWDCALNGDDWSWS
jgi:hypothetical protein